MMNKTLSPLSANDLSNNAQPTVLYITQGSFGIMSTVELRGDTLYYSAICGSEAEAIGSLNSERWHTFRQTLESLQAAQWKPHYINENALDGHQWKVKIAYADGQLIQASGSNAYPGILDGDYTIGGKQSLDWQLFTCAVTWLTDGRWNRGALEL
jgi:hypothetical protein